jgi:hypothetical protein
MIAIQRFMTASCVLLEHRYCRASRRVQTIGQAGDPEVTLCDRLHLVLLADAGIGHEARQKGRSIGRGCGR